MAIALNGYLDDVQALQDLLGPAIAAADRGELVDGEIFMSELMEETRAMVAAARAR